LVVSRVIATAEHAQHDFGKLMGAVMTYNADAAELELERLRKQPRYHWRRYAKRSIIRSINNEASMPAVEMIIGDWYVDELGMPTREITAR
jgi:hypothetical protein